MARDAFAEDSPCYLQGAHHRFLIVNKQNSTFSARAPYWSR
jgi:hypothetical protein